MKISPDLVKKFRKAHDGIVTLIDQIQQVVRFYPKARGKIGELDKVVTLHLTMQDEKLYATLAHHYEAQRDKIKTIEFLVHNLKEIKIKHLMFCDRYQQGVGEIVQRTFPKDFTEYVQELVTRLDLEEEYLFPLIEDLN